MRRGFTLAETILSAFVISLVLMALFNIFPSSAMAVKRAEMQLIADSMAERHLEQYRAAPFDSLVVGPAPAVPVEPVRGTDFATTIEVVNVPPSDPDVLKGVRVTVAWTHSGKSHTTTHEAWLVSVEN